MTHKGEEEYDGFNNRSFPHWNDLYANETGIGSLPWYNRDLDNDMKEHLRTMNTTQRRLLDLGTAQSEVRKRKGFSQTMTSRMR